MENTHKHENKVFIQNTVKSKLQLYKVLFELYMRDVIFMETFAYFGVSCTQNLGFNSLMHEFVSSLEKNLLTYVLLSRRC